jgi:hypothetical protein
MCWICQRIEREKKDADRAACICGREIYRVKGTRYWYHVDNHNHYCDAPLSYDAPAVPDGEVRL